MKFLHAADIHLDSPLTGLSSRGTVPESVTRHCTRRAFANLIDLAIAQDVAFVIIAGDLYDADWRDYSTGLFFAGEMRRLNRPCFLIRGNHDARSVITKSLVPPPNVQEFSSRKTETFLLDELGVALHGRSFPDRAVPEDLSATYPAPVSGRLNIGILHTSAEDPGEHETYAPCHVSGLIAKGYDYWALGHIHQRRALHPGNPWIVFPGNIQGRHARETGDKGCTLVDVQDGRITDVQHRTTDVLRWASVSVALDGAETMTEIAARLRFELSAAHDQAGGLPLIVRVTLSGATERHAELAADPLAIDAECRNAAAAVSGSLYIERVRLESRMPLRPLDQDGSAADLEQAFLQALDDPDVQQRLLVEFSALSAQIPSGSGRDMSPPPRDINDLRALAPEAWHIVARALSGEPA
ncbi:MAG: DNA repair exonuclease [Rhodopila sp.]|nr:DNA repair exonuclease [Rhodopila sp.]